MIMANKDYSLITSLIRDEIYLINDNMECQEDQVMREIQFNKIRELQDLRLRLYVNFDRSRIS